MKYIVASAAVLSCVFFESECGLNLRKELRNFEKGTIRQAVKNTKEDLRNVEKETMRPAVKNIKKGLRNFEKGTMRPAVKNIGRCIRDLKNEILEGNETEGAYETIQTIRKDIYSLKEGENQEGPSEAKEIDDKLSVVKKELEAARNRLNRAKLNEEFRLKEAEETGISLSEKLRYKLEIDILDEEYTVKIKELEVLHLESELKRIDKHNAV